MRTVLEFEVEKGCIVPAKDYDLDSAASSLVQAMLRDERLLRTNESELISLDEIREGFDRLTKSSSRKGPIPTDPQDARIQNVAAQVLASRTSKAGDVGPSAPPSPLANRSLCQALSIVAQMPETEQQLIGIDLIGVIDDRERDVFGLLFGRGLKFTVRMRCRGPEVLKASTARVAEALASRPAIELNDVLTTVPELARIEGSFSVHFATVALKTPVGELAQSGTIYQVKSQLGLFAHLAIQAPQIYLVWVTLVLASIDFLLEVGSFPSTTVGDLELSGWVASFAARLGSGAFGAYLVALFLRFADLRQHLRKVTKRAGHKRSAFGAFIEWSIA